LKSLDEPSVAWKKVKKYIPKKNGFIGELPW